MPPVAVRSRLLDILDESPAFEETSRVLGSLRPPDLCALSREALEARLGAAGLLDMQTQFWAGLEVLRQTQQKAQSQTAPRAAGSSHRRPSNR